MRSATTLGPQSHKTKPSDASGAPVVSRELRCAMQFAGQHDAEIRCNGHHKAAPMMALSVRWTNFSSGLVSERRRKALDRTSARIVGIGLFRSSPLLALLIAARAFILLVSQRWGLCGGLATIAE